jgi:hypothetical protein
VITEVVASWYWKSEILYRKKSCKMTGKVYFKTGYIYFTKAFFAILPTADTNLLFQSY